MEYKEESGSGEDNLKFPNFFPYLPKDADAKQEESHVSQVTQ